MIAGGPGESVTPAGFDRASLARRVAAPGYCWANSWMDSLSHLFVPFWSTLLACESHATNFLYPTSGGRPCLSRPPYPGQRHQWVSSEPGVPSAFLAIGNSRVLFVGMRGTCCIGPRSRRWLAARVRSPG